MSVRDELRKWAELHAECGMLQARQVLEMLDEMAEQDKEIKSLQAMVELLRMATVPEGF